MKHFLVLILLCVAVVSARAQSSAITYQGRLAANGWPYTGFAEMQFTLFNAPTGGVAVAASTPVIGVNVSSGLFTVPLDFGAAAFTGADRFLEIEVRTNLGAFFRLTPRQPVTPTPYALYARTAGAVTNNSITAASIAGGQVVKSLNGLEDTVNLVAGTNIGLTTSGNSVSLSAGPWLPNGSSTFYNGGNVGIGTTSPQNLLHVNGDVRWGGDTTNFVYSGEDGGGLFIEQSGNSSAKSGIRLQTSKSGNASDYAQFFINPNNGFSFFSLGTGNGNVGIGTTTPQARLDVRGDVRLGPSGQYRATAGEENLRIVRGVVAADGATIAGSGFTVSHVQQGVYNITFNQAFNGLPAVTATGRNMFAVYSLLTVNSVTIALINDFGNPLDREFAFIAIGPR